MEKADHNIDTFCFGEVLWDVLPDGPQPGGAPLNVAYHLNKFGVKTSVISKIGNDEPGRQLEKLIDDWNIDKQFLQVDEEHGTSKVIADVNDNHEVSYEIIYPVAWDFITQANEIRQSLTPSTYLVYGSLASRSIITRNTLLNLLETDCIKVFDINLRPPHFEKDTLKLLLSEADIVKFNRAELELAGELFGGLTGDEPSLVKFIQAEFSIAEVIVTNGERGASYYSGNEHYFASGGKIKVADTIGSGDAFLAAFIAGHKLKASPHEILDQAVAMGAFIATRKGGCPEYDLNQYQHFKAQLFCNVTI